MAAVIGSIIVADGRGKVTVVEPMGDNTVLVADTKCPAKVRFTNMASLLSSKNILISMPVPTSKLLISDLFKQMGKFIFPGSNTSRIVSVIISSYSPTGSSYDLRIYDPSTSNILATLEGLANKESTMNNFVLSKNLPDVDTVVELHAKSNASGLNKHVTFDQMYITYNIV